MRGSSHHHGLYWIPKDGEPYNLMTKEGRDAFVRHWGLYITAINPELDRVMD